MTKEQLEELLNNSEELQNHISALIAELTDDEDFVYTIKVFRLSEEFDIK